MAAVTQLIPNYIGGVSRQADERKFPGQLTEATNVYCDPTFGLTKRPGTQFLKVLETYDDSSDPFEHAAWFFISRDDDEAYFGCLANGRMYAWNAAPDWTNGYPEYTPVTWYDGTNGVDSKVPINWDDSKWDYLKAYGLDDDGNTVQIGSHGHFKFVTVQDATYVINRTKVVEVEPTTPYTLKQRGTIRVESIDNGTNYKVYKNGSLVCDYKAPTPDLAASPPEDLVTAETIIAGIAAELAGDFETITQLGASIELYDSTPFDLDCEGGVSGVAIRSFQDTVANVSRLPATSINGRRVEIRNTQDDAAVWFAKYVPDTPGTPAGQGYWLEDLGWSEDENGNTVLASTGLKNETMPFKLINDQKNEFWISQTDYAERKVGSDASNEHPSFVGKKISEGFVYSNRLGFLSEENIILSESNSFDKPNFYFQSARAITDADPIDLNVSSLRPAKLHAVIPQAQGLILFSEFEQFVMFSDDGFISPTTVQIRSISKYQNDVNITPVDVGTQIYFVNKTPGYTKTMGMNTKANLGNPSVVDFSKVAAEYVPKDVDYIVGSSQNTFVMHCSQDRNDIQFFRTFSDGEQDIMQAWFKWIMPGTVQAVAARDEHLFFVLKVAGQYVMCNASMVQDTADIPQATTNPNMDFFAPAYRRTGPNPQDLEIITYDAATGKSKIPHQFNDSPDLTPMLVLVPDGLQPNTYISSYKDFELYSIPSDTLVKQFGTILAVERDDDGNWYVDGDYTGQETHMMVGWQVNTEIELPRTYFKSENLSDYTADTTIARMKFSLSTTGEVIFQVKQRGAADWVNHSATTLADYYLADNVPVVTEKIMTTPIHQKNTNFIIRLLINTPFPFSLNSMMWEGRYSPRFYRRT